MEDRIITAVYIQIYIVNSIGREIGYVIHAQETTKLGGVVSAVKIVITGFRIIEVTAVQIGIVLLSQVTCFVRNHFVAIGIAKGIAGVLNHYCT